jgi:hypothetical protein
VAFSSVVGAGYSAEMSGVRRKQIEYLDEACPKRNCPDTPPLQPTSVIGMF